MLDFDSLLPKSNDIRRDLRLSSIVVNACYMNALYVPITVMLISLLGCNKQDKKSEEFSFRKAEALEVQDTLALQEKASTRIELDNKGVGKRTSLVLHDDIDDKLVQEGKAIFELKCTVCHRVGEKFIGPAPDGITKRRSPEWIMNMILDPQLMVKEDPLARDLFMEFNGVPMTNQGLTEDESRAVLEYFRTL